MPLVLLSVVHQWSFFLFFFFTCIVHFSGQQQMGTVLMRYTVGLNKQCARPLLAPQPIT